MGTLKKQLRQLAAPIFMEVALVMLVGFVDTLMLSRYSDNAVAAVGLDNQIIMLVFLVYQFVSTGAGIVCAQYHGAGLRRRFVQVVGIALLINAAVGLFASALLYFHAEDIVRLMGLRPALVPEGATYLKITGSLSFFQSLTFAFTASLRSVGRVKAPMLVTALANVVNALGDYAFIFGHWGFPAMGVAGAAWATAASRIVAFACIAFIHYRTHIPKFPLAWFRPFPLGEVRNVFKIGLPAMGEELSYCLSQVTITYFVNKISTDALIVRTYAVNCIMFVYLFCLSITQGGDILVGHLVGRERYTPAYLMGNYFLGRSMVITLACSVLLAAGGPWLFAALSSNPEVVRLGTIILWIDCVLEVGRVRNIFACGTLRSAGDAIYPLVVGLASQWGIAVGLGWLFAIPLEWGLVGAWVAFAIDENLRGVILMHRWHTKGWVGRSFAARTT